MRVLVTGIKGQLGYDVVRCLEKRGIDHIGVDIDDFDITDYNKTRDFIINSRADIVIHCSAFTAVDQAETDSELCFKVNVDGTKHIASVCKEIDATLVYISTDYIFSGTGDEYYEVNDNKKRPLSVYGESKLKGEEAVIELLEKFFIIRISWAFGLNGNNFVKTMLRLGEIRDEINVVSDQYGSPTYTSDLAKLICDMILTEKYGIYHATNEGICSWAEFAQEIFKLVGSKTKVNFVSSDEYPVKAIRPKNSRLSKKKLDENGFKRLPDWKDALARFLFELKLD